MKLDHFILAIKVVYKNVRYKRPKHAVTMFVIFGLLTSIGGYVTARDRDHAFCNLIFSLVSFFVIGPIILYFLDVKSDPERIDYLFRTTSNFYSFKIPPK